MFLGVEKTFLSKTKSLESTEGGGSTPQTLKFPHDKNDISEVK